jgi:arylsulfatase A-like enzyme/tetratricopeptide (TPR) repeat protein
MKTGHKYGRAWVGAALLPALLSAPACGARDNSNALTKSPDVLLITIDTLRADAIGVYGAAGGMTPVIDRLAASGTRFESAHAHAVLTLPSHASVLSSRYPFAHGVRDNAGFRFPPSMDTLATWLRARGYRTGAFVSAFPLDARFGLARGFDEYDDRLSGSPRPAFLEQERDARDTVARARAWLAAGDGRPSFCWVHLFEPHYPYAPPEPFASKYAPDSYKGEVAATDAALAPLLQPILDGPERESTIVVLTADHGESLGEHGEATHGIFTYESTLRVPLVIRARGLQHGIRQDDARHVDIAPTILDLLSIPVPPDLDGRSLRGSPTNPPSYFEALSGALNRGWAPPRGVIRGGLKFIDLPIPELYDLSADRGEATNLANARTADVQSMRALLQTFPVTPVQAGRESGDAAARLRALGYTSGGTATRQAYTEADDPKRIIAIDREIQQIVADYAAGNGAAALASARTFATRHPRMTIGWLQLAHLERESGNLKGGIEALQKAHTIDGGNVQVTTLLGAYLTQDNRAGEAIALLSPVAARDDADVEVLRTLALATARAGSPDAALALLQRARAVDPGEAQLLVDEGTVALMADRRGAARAAFEQALTRDPALTRAHSSLAALAVDEGRTADAIVHWREAVARDPSEFGRIFALGVAQARAGRRPQARAALKFFAAAAPSARYAGEIAQARAWLAQPR